MDEHSPRVQQAFVFFVQMGWTKEQAAGIVGNLQAESGVGLHYETAVGDGGTAFGLAQWRFERVTTFYKVFGYPLKGSNLEDQLSYVHWELNNTEKAAGNRLRNAKTAADAAAIVDQYYERSSGEARGLRITYAQNILKRYGDSI